MQMGLLSMFHGAQAVLLPDGSAVLAAENARMPQLWVSLRISKHSQTEIQVILSKGCPTEYLQVCQTKPLRRVAIPQEEEVELGQGRLQEQLTAAKTFDRVRMVCWKAARLSALAGAGLDSLQEHH